MSIEGQAECVNRVKRAENLIVERPYTISLEEKVDQARERMAQAEVGGLVVVDSDGVLLGLVTTRDVLLAKDGQLPIRQVMTPRDKLVVAGVDEALEDARQLLHKHRIEKLPLVDGEGHLAGLITAQDIIKVQDHPDASKDSRDG